MNEKFYHKYVASADGAEELDICFMWEDGELFFCADMSDCTLEELNEEAYEEAYAEALQDAEADASDYAEWTRDSIHSLGLYGMF